MHKPKRQRARPCAAAGYPRPKVTDLATWTMRKPGRRPAKITAAPGLPRMPPAGSVLAAQMPHARGGAAHRQLEPANRRQARLGDAVRRVLWADALALGQVEDARDVVVDAADQAHEIGRASCRERV